MVHLLGKKIRKIQAGKEHFLALSSTGKIYTWGDNSKSQLGLDSNYILTSVFPNKQGLLNGAQLLEEEDDISEVDYCENLEDERTIKAVSVPSQVTTKPS